MDHNRKLKIYIVSLLLYLNRQSNIFSALTLYVNMIYKMYMYGFCEY